MKVLPLVSTVKYFMTSELLADALSVSIRDAEVTPGLLRRNVEFTKRENGTYLTGN